MIKNKRLCKCGCSRSVRQIYCSGHNPKPRRERHHLFGKHHSKEMKKKLSKAHLGKRYSDEVNKKKGLSGEKNPNFGKHLSEEQKQKISKANQGKYISPETRKKMSETHKGEKAYWFGKHHSEETRKKLATFSGEKSSMWKGGVSFIPYPFIFNKKLKKFIRHRDHNECQNPYCSRGCTKLTVHHIDYCKENCSQFNLITLCRSCNSRANDNHRLWWQRLYNRIIWSKYN